MASHKNVKAGIGPPGAAFRIFDDLTADVLLIRGMQAKCAQMDADDKALQIAVEGLETAAYHFTRRRLYYEQIKVDRPFGQNFFPGLGERAEVIATLDTLIPYAKRLRDLQWGCTPFGRDYLALDIPLLCLGTMAYHFTKIASYYGARGESGGPCRDPAIWA